ncbi:MAG: AAA family ATPase [bacterium]|nr:AAA family ATPase [bacterium]
MERRLATGLAFGKFDPPHRGHSLLFDVALGHVDRLIVLVWDYPGQSVPAQQRARWLREIVPEADVRVIPDDPNAQPSDVVAQAAHAKKFLRDDAIDMLFTSESYGEVFAKELGIARHFTVDRDRMWVPVSGTTLRRSPLDHLEFLEPCVRAHYVRRIGVVGSESTGKTTLSRRLSAHYQTLWVPEYGREYTLVKYQAGASGEFLADEFYHIAREQQRREDEAARSANRLLICDTDVLATKIWYERYLQMPAPWIPIAPSRIALYVVPFPDTPYVQDEIRDAEHLRFWMYERFVEEIEKLGVPHVVLQGTFDERYEQAIAAIDALDESEREA